MKTTLDLPDELLRAIKVRAAQEDRRLKDLVADLLRIGLAHHTTGAGANRVRLPLVQSAHRARAGEELTPQRVAAVLLDEESQDVAEA